MPEFSTKRWQLVVTGSQKAVAARRKEGYGRERQLQAERGDNSQVEGNGGSGE